MARYTEQDRERVLRARMALALGERVASVSVAGRTIAYAQGASLRDLNALLAEIEVDLDAQRGVRRSRSRRAITSKGL